VCDQVIEPYQKIQTKIGVVLYLQEEIRTVARKPMVFISGKQADVTIPVLTRKIVLKGMLLELNRTMELYHNGRLVTKTTLLILPGDVLLLDTIRFEIYQKYIVINASKQDYQTILKEIRGPIYHNEGFPLYYRSPRIIQKIDQEAIEIKDPPLQEALLVKGIFMTFVPTVLSVCISVGLGVVMGRGILLLMTVASSMVAFITNGTKYYHDKREVHRKNSERTEVYDGYLLETRKQIYQKTKYNQNVLTYQYPSLETIQKMVCSNHHRMYERTMQDTDFLEVQIGTFLGNSFFKITYKQDDWDLKKDLLKEKAKALQQEYLNECTVPLCINLQKGHVGLVGERKVLYQQLQAYIMELTFFHSYHDMKIVCIYNLTMKDIFSYVKWYPHLQMNHMIANVYEETFCNQVMGNLYQLLKERRNKLKESHYKISFTPHIVCIIVDITLIKDHRIMEFLQLDTNALGYSIIYLADTSSLLPENIKTILSFEDMHLGTLLIREGVYVKQSFIVHDIKNIHFEMYARRLAGYKHVEKKQLQIPQQVKFLEMYQIKKIEDYPLLQQWQDNNIYENMAVPIGMRSNDTLTYLDLHEQAHGPHGLIAGTTGSGKSEMIQSYILSLALHFHPHDIGFLLIDYKGGGMANLFKELPHMVGTITNLSGNEALRALISIQSEVKRRQYIFKTMEINTINAYTKAFKKHMVKEALPHIFIICDEFAELKKVQPEFMDGLISIARIGRSLGIHLILATQKPSGVVDDQIWSNARFKICLKVQNEADSKEVLKTPDAASITQIGRGYLQVGNNEIYEMFQSAYSGSPYLETQKARNSRDVYIFNDIGQSYALNKDWHNVVITEKEETQLEVIISYIKQVYQTMASAPVKKPWVSELSNNIVLPVKKQALALDLSCEIGIIDIPEQQTQAEYSLDLQKDGHILYFAATGYGKTMFLSTVMLSLARKNKVALLHFYIIDFGSHALFPFDQLLHTADYITFDDDERFNKLMQVLQTEIKQRKKLFMKQQIQNFTLYNQMNNQKIPSLVIIIDQFDVMKEKGIEAEMFFSKLARDGASLGIYLVMTGNHQADIRYATLYQIKNKIVGYVFDPLEVTQILGRSEWKLPDSKGRVLVKTDTIHLGQLFLPVSYQKEEAYPEAIRGGIAKINEQNKGCRAKRMAVLPKQLLYQDLKQYKKEQTKEFIIGLHHESVDVVGHSLTNEPFLIIGPSRCGKTNVLKMLYQQISGQKYVFDTLKMSFNAMDKQQDTKHVHEENGYHQTMLELQEQLAYRKRLFQQTYQKNSHLQPHEFYQSLPSYTCFIDDGEYFYEVFSLIPEIHKTIPQMLLCGIRFIVCEDSMKTSAMHPLAQVFKRTSQGLVLGACTFSNPFQISMSQVPLFGNGLLCKGNERVQVKIAKFDDN
jgi:S-DNA-T family DNA segregation ATPase FtsK/SpoIIIE